jgi:hypothetical protein
MALYSAPFQAGVWNGELGVLWANDVLLHKAVNQILVAKWKAGDSSIAKNRRGEAVHKVQKRIIQLLTVYSGI